MILSGVCIMVAAFFLLRRNFDVAFVIAALGLVAWFLNYRAQMKEIIVAANLQESSSEDEEESHEDSDDE
jgi:preprotein translocase subunit SecF